MIVTMSKGKCVYVILGVIVTAVLLLYISATRNNLPVSFIISKPGSRDELIKKSDTDTRDELIKKSDTERRDELIKKSDTERRDELNKKSDTERRDELIKKSDTERRDELIKKSDTERRDELNKKSDTEKRDELNKKSDTERRDELNKKSDTDKRDELIKKSDTDTRDELIKKSDTAKISEVSELLLKILREPTDLTKVVLNKSCTDISTLAGCYDKTCPQSISLDPRTRVRDLFSTGKLELTPSQRDLVLSISEQIQESDVIIASASSSNHYQEMQAMFQNIHQVVYPRLNNFSVVLFDIGLSPEERKMTEKNCRCQVLRFPAEIFPPHVKNNKCYSWKPLIILAAISKARKYLVWQDSSVRWADNFRTIFDRTNIYGHQMLRYIDSSRVPANTIKQTFDYFGDQPCAYLPYPEIQGNCMLHKHDPLVIKAVLEPWARCALEKDCICPAEPGSVLACRPDLKIHRCHRFDQSAITIIMAKVYGEDMYRFISPETNFRSPTYIFVKRGHSVSDYFKNI